MSAIGSTVLCPIALSHGRDEFYLLSPFEMRACLDVIENAEQLFPIVRASHTGSHFLNRVAIARRNHRNLQWFEGGGLSLGQRLEAVDGFRNRTFKGCVGFGGCKNKAIGGGLDPNKGDTECPALSLRRPPGLPDGH